MKRRIVGCVVPDHIDGITIYCRKNYINDFDKAVRADGLLCMYGMHTDKKAWGEG